MKVTSFEISKKLAEIGFKPDTDFCWIDRYSKKLYHLVHYAEANFKTLHFDTKYRAYDLETILEALPKVIDGMPLKMRLDRSDNIGYLPSPAYAEIEEQHVCFKRANESLADTAARLLILLHEKELINFK